MLHNAASNHSTNKKVIVIPKWVRIHNRPVSFPAYRLSKEVQFNVSNVCISMTRIRSSFCVQVSVFSVKQFTNLSGMEAMSIGINVRDSSGLQEIVSNVSQFIYSLT